MLDALNNLVGNTKIENAIELFKKGFMFQIKDYEITTVCQLCKQANSTIQVMFDVQLCQACYNKSFRFEQSETNPTTVEVVIDSHFIDSLDDFQLQCGMLSDNDIERCTAKVEWERRQFPSLTVISAVVKLEATL